MTLNNKLTFIHGKYLYSLYVRRLKYFVKLTIMQCIKLASRICTKFDQINFIVYAQIIKYSLQFSQFCTNVSNIIDINCKMSLI